MFELMKFSDRPIPLDRLHGFLEWLDEGRAILFE
jgi:hypothetical protein